VGAEPLPTTSRSPPRKCTSVLVRFSCRRRPCHTLDSGAMHPTPDPYIVLGVDSGANHATIRAAYRGLARAYHPDVDGGSEAAMTRLNQAWAVLGNPEARAAYHLERGLPPPGSVVPPGPRAPAPPGVRQRSSAPAGTVLDFGRYAGWSIGDLAR